MTYHLIDFKDVEILKKKGFIYYIRDYSTDFKYKQEYLEKRLKTKFESFSMPAGFIREYGGKEMVLLKPLPNDFCIGTLHHSSFFVYDTKEFWKDVLDESKNNFEEIEL